MSQRTNLLAITAMATGFPLLPSALPVPHDLVCEGTAWSAKRSVGGYPTSHDALDINRRDWW